MKEGRVEISDFFIYNVCLRIILQFFKFFIKERGKRVRESGETGVGQGRIEIFQKKILYFCIKMA